MTQRHPAIRRPASLREAAPMPGAQPPNSPALRSGLALGLSAAMLAPLAATAQTAATPAGTADKAQETRLPEVKARAQVIDPNPNAQTGVPYKARTSGDSRHTRPLAETPQTLQVITKKAIEESGVTDLRAILDAQPGITLGTGENGNAFGDRYIIRGQEARSDVFVDGLRDPGMTIRESFAVEQVEISKGPNSSFAGRGTVGGAVNGITKQATLDYDFNRLSASLGSAGHLRSTLDSNHIFSDQFAVRANVLHGQEDVPGRSPSDRRRQGLALSALYEVAKDREITLDYYGLRAHDRLDLGSYLVGTAPHRLPANPVPPSYVQDQDFLDSKVDTLTARVKWRLGDNSTINSITRFGTTSNGYVVTGARSATAYTSASGTDGAYTTASLSTHNGWQDVSYFAHQTNLQINNQLFGLKNELILSAEISDHHVIKGTWNIANAGAFNCRTSGTATANNGYCLYDSAGAVVPGLNGLLGRSYNQGIWNTDWRVRTLALAVMDTVDLNDRWTAFAGLRGDRFNYDLTTRSAAGVLASYPYSDTLWNGHLGLTYKLQPGAIVYGSVASAADINGGESDVGTSSGYGGAVIYNGQIAGAKPEQSLNFELGTKWDLLDGRLLATAALFQTTKRGVMEGADYASVGTFNTGKNRVQGVELGLVGALTDKLSGQVGLAVMKSRVLASATASNVGHSLSNFADKSASAQLRYQATEAFAFGGTAKYESQRCAGQPDTGAVYTADGLCAQPVPGYTTLDLFASYRFNRALEGRVNVLNVTDKDYYLAAYRSGSFLYKGDARAVRVTVDYKF